MHNRRRKLALLSLAGVLVLALVALVSATGAELSEAQDGAMQNCPQADKWAIAVWSGDDGTDAAQALATCGEGAVAVAYTIDPDTQVWSRWFAGRPDISNLTVLNNMQGVVALGGTAAAATLTPSPTPTPTATPAPPAAGAAMQNCPLQSKWAIAVWDGDDGTDAEQALATCGEESVAVAYSIDPETQAWLRWFAGRPEISNLTTLDNMQGVMALGGTGAAVTPTPSPTPSPTATPTPTATGGPPTDYLDTFHAAFDTSIQGVLVELNWTSEGDFEAPDRCSCDVSHTIGGALDLHFEDHIVVIGNKAWIDEGDGWTETTPSEVPVRLFDMCPACPSFWEEYSLEVPPDAGEHDTRNGVPAIHYSVSELCEDFAGLGIWTPEELEGASIQACDIWLAEEGYWPVRLDMEMSQVPSEAWEWSSTAVTIDITRANDPTIEVNAP